MATLDTFRTIEVSADLVNDWQPSIILNGGDDNGRRIRLTVTDDGQPVSPSGITARLEFDAGSGKTGYVTMASVSGASTATFEADVPRAALTGNSTINMGIALYRDDRTICTRTFAAEVEPAALRVSDDSVQDAMQEFRAAVSKVDSFADGAIKAETQRATAENARVSAENARVSAENARVSAENNRASAESSRVSAESTRVRAETSRSDAEQSRVTAEAARVEAEKERETQQAKNNADQAQNNAAAQGLLVAVLGDGQYDTSTLEPTISGEVGKLYLVPDPNAQDDNAYAEWMYISGNWERVGTSTASVEPVTTDQIDTVAADGSVTSSNALTGTGLTYLWAKLKAAFASVTHRHSASDITSGTLSVARGGTGAATASAALTSLGAASASDLAAVRDSLSRFEAVGGATKFTVDSLATANPPQPVVLRVESTLGVYGLIASSNGLSLWSYTHNKSIWNMRPSS